MEDKDLFIIENVVATDASTTQEHLKKTTSLNGLKCEVVSHKGRENEQDLWERKKHARKMVQFV